MFTLLKILCLLGIITFPIITFGCVLIYFNHPILGAIALIVGILHIASKSSK